MAADRVFQVPSGWWIPDPAHAAYALRGDTLAVAVVNAAPPVAASRVLQIRGLSGPGPGTVVTTDVPGEVTFIEVAPNEQRVYAHSKIINSGNVSWVGTLISSQGAVIWSQATERLFNFSTTGEVLLGTASGLTYLGPTVYVYSTQNALLNWVSFAASEDGVSFSAKELRGVVLVADGSTVICATDKKVVRLRFGSPPTSIWEFQNPSCDTDFIGLRTLDSTRIVAERSDGGFLILRVSDGVVEYDFDPWLLAQSDPTHTRDGWASYEPYAGPTPGTVTLFNRTGTAFNLDIATGVLTPTALNVSVSSGQAVRDRIDGRRLVILGTGQVRVRPIVP